MTELIVGPAGEIPQSDTIHTLFFSTAGTGTFTVPAGATKAIFTRSGCDFVAKVGGAAAWPTASETGSTYGAVNIVALGSLKAAATIGIATNAAGVIQAHFYSGAV